MTTRCNIIIRNENQIRREVSLYQHTDGHPNNMILALTEELREIYNEFNEHGDTDWFMNPCKLSGALIVRSVPIMTDEMKKVMNSLPSSVKHKFESSYFLGMPNILPEIGRNGNCNYEYVITLKEDVENNFLGYKLEAQKLQSGRRILEVFSHEENLSYRTSLLTADSVIAATKDVDYD